jgi:DNA mismatch repair protein MutS
MVEMDEAANIVNNATKYSLIVLDEVGRGTSTYDGVSIAWALAEYLVNDVKARTLFATHYHELLKLSEKVSDRVKNYNVLVEEDIHEGTVIFLRKIVEGGTDRSYGIYVAKMAGLPDKVVKRAKEILEGFEQEKMFGKDSQIRDTNIAQTKKTGYEENNGTYQ